MKRLAAVLLVLAALATAARARPSKKLTKQLITTLVVPPDDAPDYLCVVTAMPGAQSIPIERLLAAKLIVAQKGRWVFAVPKKAAAATDELRGKNPHVVAAVELLGRHDDSSCSGDHEGCRPALRFFDDVYQTRPDKSGHITCGRNAAPAGKGKVAVVGLRFHVESRAVDSVKLTGSGATLNFAQAIQAEEVVFGAVLGGHYATRSEANIGTNTTLAVRLEPRCSPSTVILPPPAVEDNEIEMALTAGKERSTCRARITAGNSVTLQVPHDSESRLKALKVTVGTTTFATRWIDPLPARQLELGHETAQVFWQRHCLLPKKSCPRLRLIATGKLCKRQDEAPVGQCAYRCEADKRKPFLLPAPVRFEYGQSSEDDSVLTYRWDDTLDYSEEVLTSFVPPDEGRIRVNFEDVASWKSIKGDRLTDLEIRGANDLVQRIKLPPRKPRVVVRVPGVSCDDRVTVQIRGDRRYEARNEELKGGAITVERPHEYLEGTRLGVLLGGTMALPDLFGEGERVEPQALIGVYAAYPLARSLGADWRRFHLEGEVTFDLTRMGFPIVRPENDPSLPDLAYVTYYHVTGLLGLSRSYRKFRAGGALGAGWGNPLVRGDRHVGGMNPFLAGALFIRWAMTREVWLEVSTGFRLGEKRYEFKTDFAGEPIPDADHRFVWLLLTGKVRFGP